MPYLGCINRHSSLQEQFMCHSGRVGFEERPHCSGPSQLERKCTVGHLECWLPDLSLEFSLQTKWTLDLVSLLGIPFLSRKGIPS